MWSRDLAVLVARLCTYRGRLPQGAPTSPALANLAFAPLDEKIRSNLGPDLVYSRYFDDITVSASKNAAKRLRLRDETVLGKYVEQRLKAVLAPSGFRLNSRKTHVGKASTGFTITGLRVQSDRIHLPRSAKRELRELTRCVSRYGLYATARQHFGAETWASLAWNERREQHFHEDRRLSQEKLCVLMVRRLMPDLEVYVLRQHAEDGPKATLAPVEKKGRWRAVERILSFAWTNQVRLRMHDDYVEVRDSSDIKLAELRSQHPMQFFVLLRNDAVACTELYLKLSGWRAFLAVAENSIETKPLADVGRSIQKTLSNVGISTPRISIEVDDAPPISTKSGPVLFTPEQENENLAKETRHLVRQFGNYLAPGTLDLIYPKLEQEFITATTSRALFDQWLTAAFELCNNSLPFLPKETPQKGFGGYDVHYALRILHERQTGLRSYQYEFEKLFWRQRSRDEDPKEAGFYLSRQYQLLGRIRTAVSESLDLRTTRGEEQWMRSLIPNEGATSISERLNASVDELFEAHRLLVSSEAAPRLFRNSILRQITDCRTALSARIDGITTELRWEALFQTGKILADLTLEVVEKPMLDGARQRLQEKRAPSVGTNFEVGGQEILNSGDANESKQISHSEIAIRAITQFFPDNKMQTEMLRLIHLLRCRAAHPMTGEQMEDWKRIQIQCAKLLGRAFRLSKESNAPEHAFGAGHLELTAMEAEEIKLFLIQGLARLLQFVSQRLEINDERSR